MEERFETVADRIKYWCPLTLTRPLFLYWPVEYREPLRGKVTDAASRTCIMKDLLMRELLCSDCSPSWRVLQLNRKIHKNTIRYLNFQPHLLLSIPSFWKRQTSITPQADRNKIRSVASCCPLEIMRSEEDVALFVATSVEKAGAPLCSSRDTFLQPSIT